ncbi:hypothetical protein JB92DRAFT_2110768 [Gautieria morchelliformis]|nr:hypothetical protein JB92DRAFT_2110768 [Gautieria morchelliformis]
MSSWSGHRHNRFGGLLTLLDLTSNIAEREIYPMNAGLGIGMLFHTPFTALTNGVSSQDRTRTTGAFYRAYLPANNVLRPVLSVILMCAHISMIIVYVMSRERADAPPESIRKSRKRNAFIRPTSAHIYKYKCFPCPRPFTPYFHLPCRQGLAALTLLWLQSNNTFGSFYVSLASLVLTLPGSFTPTNRPTLVPS